jgi:O-methyltransferase involved in polyketide biosynthesis
MDKINVFDLPPVARTLLVPLAARARDSARPDALIRDPRAVELFNHFEGGLDSVKKMSNFDHVLRTMVVRQFDLYTRTFLNANPDGLVVDIGCGLSTRFDRLDNGQMSWLGLDLPEVIELRQHLLPDTERCHSLACSMLDLVWLDTVAQMQKPVIFLAEGVFPYFTEAEVKRVITAMSARFPGAELVFDGYSSIVVWGHKNNAMLKETGARINWTVNDPRQLEHWGLRLLEKWGYFDHHEPRLGMGNLMRYIPLMSDVAYVLHYTLEPRDL